MVSLDQQEDLVHPETKELLDNKVTLENQVKQEVRELAEMLDVQDLRVKLVSALNFKET